MLYFGKIWQASVNPVATGTEAEKRRKSAFLLNYF